MKKIVVAFDSFKGSLTSYEASEAFIAGVKSVDPAVECYVVAIADGGEGMAEAIVEGVGGAMATAMAHDPIGREIKASYGVINEGATAIIPISSASGITLLAPEERNPLYATTYGTGELLLEGTAQLQLGIGFTGLGGSECRACRAHTVLVGPEGDAHAYGYSLRASSHGVALIDVGGR